jgi:hypothetical protein
MTGRGTGDPRDDPDAETMPAQVSAESSAPGAEVET